MKKGKGMALLPIGVFLVLYLGLGILFEYVMEIPMGFYNVPIVVAFLAAILVACLQNRALDFDKKLEIMAQGVGDKNIITMLLIFLAAGSFVGVVGRSSAESVAYCMLSLIPARFSVSVLFIVACFVSVAMGTSVGTITLLTPIASAESVAYCMLSLIPARFSVSVLFIVACFVSVAMGTSVGTITLLTPIAAAVSTASGFDLAFCVASVMGGAMFGDNLSFISDTTIAACNGQGCEMKDKFRENFWIALPAAVATLILILILSFQTEIQGRVVQPYHLTQVIPYVLVLIGGIVGINVFVVLLTGIVSGAFIMLIGGYTTPVEILKNMGSGVSGMFETCMVAILVAAMCALIREYGGFDALLGWIHKIFRGKKGGQLGMGLLVGTMDIATANNTVAIVMANPIAKEMAEEYGITPRKTASILELGMGLLVGTMDIATANNTVAIVMANPIAKEMAEEYGITPRKTASILDTFSCVFQGVIPYGAQMLVAISAVNELGGEISAFQIMPKLFYPMLLLFSSLITIMRGN